MFYGDIMTEYGGGLIFPAGFEKPPGAEIGSKNHVFNDHTYCCTIAGDGCATGEPAPDTYDECLDWHQRKIGQRNSDAEKLGIPFFLSEFGACFTEGPCT